MNLLQKLPLTFERVRDSFGNLHSGGHTLRTYVPQEVYARFSPELKLLYRHLAEGEEDVLQPENQHKALRARFVDQPALRDPDRFSTLPLAP